MSEATCKAKITLLATQERVMCGEPATANYVHINYDKTQVLISVCDFCQTVAIAKGKEIVPLE